MYGYTGGELKVTKPSKRGTIIDEVGIPWHWWMLPGGVLIGLLMAFGALWLDRQGVWPEWLDYSRSVGFFDKRTGERIPILPE